MGPWTRASVARESWSNPQALGHWPKMLRTAGRPPGASEAGVSNAGQVVNPVGQKTQTKVALECLSKPLALRPKR